MHYRTLLASFVLGLSASAASAQQTLLLEQPAISADHIAFVYAGDIWIADRDGSNPRRLTSHPAEESEPAFSPDGSLIAYAGDYERNRDVYVISVDGGQPKRLTWHPGPDTPTGWVADGSAVTFASGRETDHGRSGQLYHASLDGGLPERRMAARFYRGAYNADDSQLAYIAFGSGYNGLFGGTSGWKGYRGGTTPAILVMDFESNAVQTVPGAGATNFDPFWLGDDLYFLSDREDELFNVFRYRDGAIERITSEDLWEVRGADGDGSTIVYEAGGRLKTFDVDSGSVEELEISLNPDLPQLRMQWKDAAGTIQSGDISPNGKRAIITARGDVFTVPVDDGSTRNITASNGVREYEGIWSPKGDRVAYIVESLEGQSLVLVDQTGNGERREYALGPHFYSNLQWSPGDEERIVYQDNHLRLYAIALEDGDIETLAEGARREQIDAAFSPDGRWLAYTRERPNFHRQIMLHDFANGTASVVTDGDADASVPAFSRDGKYLYFAASTNSGPGQVGLNMTSQERPYRAGVYAAVLAADGDSPLAPVTGDEEQADVGDDDDDANSDEEQVVTEIDIDGLADRIVALPVAEANYGRLASAKDGKLYFIDRVQPGVANLPPGENAAEENVLRRFDFEEQEASDVVSGVTDFSLSAGGSHLIIAKADGSIAVAEVGDSIEAEPLDVSGLRVRVDPRVEWGLIFDEAWRMEKEFFYDPDMHGLDWDAIYAQYRPLVDHVGRREDLNDLIVEMIAEMQVGHNRISGGDVHREQGSSTGLLGANFELDRGRYRVSQVYSGEAWNPFLEAPLASPGNQVQAGEYILAINGVGLTADDNIFERLQGTAGSQVSLTVGPSANGRNSREVVVKPVESEGAIRLWNWVEKNRAAVDAATDGRVGYVYLPNTAGAGYTFFNRMFYAQVDKDAIIFDERSNGGGQAANYIVEVLSRTHLSGWKDRDGLVFNTPAGALHGPKLMMIDQDAGSGGDYLPHTFRYLGIGKLLGTRTWGGLIGIATNPVLADGGRLVVPYFRFFDAGSRWTVENEGVAPDIEVQLDPILTNEGRDSQLEAAIAEILGELDAYVPTVPSEAPPYPTELGK